MGQGGNLLVRLDSVDVPLLPSEPEEYKCQDRRGQFVLSYKLISMIIYIPPSLVNICL